MSESLKVDFLFEYKRTEDGLYHGQVQRIVNGEASWIKASPVTLPQRGWIEYVVNKIKDEPRLRHVGFLLSKQGDKVVHRFDERTIQKIQAGELTAEDLIL